MILLKQSLTAVITLLFLQTNAQENPRRLQVGEKVPDIEFNGMYNYPTKTAKLSDFKGKAVILDFWNKSCSSCIAAFPKLQKLQDKFKDELVVLLINHVPDETRETLALLFKKSPILREITLPMVFGDENYSVYNRKGLFPHTAPLYHVWIDKNGIIRATTMGWEATYENIQKLVKGERLDVSSGVHLLKEKDSTVSWLSYNNGQFINKLLYYKSANFTFKHNKDEGDLKALLPFKLGEQYHSLFMKPLYAGNLASRSGAVYSRSHKQIGSAFPDAPLRMHYFHAYQSAQIDRIIVDDDKPLDLKTYYLYEFTQPNYSDSLFNEAFKQDLEDFFGFRGTVEVRKVESFILRRTEKALKLVSKGGAEIYEDTQSSRGTIIRNRDMETLRLHLYWSSTVDRYGNHANVLDETGINESTKIDITIYNNLENLTELNKELSKYGLGIKRELRMLPVLVLRKVK
jgi:thiol-disulfide isomerase/thioredoxin